MTDDEVIDEAPIDGFDLVAQRGEEQRMTAAAGSHIKDFPFGKAMKLLEEK